ncbi:diphosphomevalonate decarboxylase [Alligator mississippiensis]|uniref:Diphosphomevalonate decarboxylase n=1 Tax=Alligator mississippiensis TaxID=8496 RepID=A0A151NKP2_ALLMI|nr:diphosphomevalonate decarboxylase [Alligator mississippiensis]
MAGEQVCCRVTCTAPVNIAVIKYWGKRDSELILPINSSLSVTLNQDQLKTTTTAAISRDFKEDRLWLNGEEADITHPRLQNCLREMRRLARKRRSGSEGDTAPLNLTYKLHIASVNNFPTAAGLASSAAGYACLVYTLARLYGADGDLSEVARQGSGSACRSLSGGFVQWLMGERPDGKDSVAQQVMPETHWPQLRVLILVVSAEKKPVGSTAGMQTSVDTSPLLKFHATCLDTFPPIFYLTDVSRRVIALAHRFNTHHGATKVAYTFDAGPNAVIFTLEDTVDEFVEVVKCSFPPESNGDQFLQGLPVGPAVLSEELQSAVVLEPVPGAIRYILHTQPGPGPQLLEDPSLHLLGPDGLPLRSASAAAPGEPR